MDTISVKIPETMSWNEIWEEVWFHPGTSTFESILDQADASAVRGFKWVGVTTALVGFIGILIFMISLPTEIPFNFLLLATLGSFILFPIVTIIVMAIDAGILHGVATLMEGTGTYGKLVFCLAAVQAPSTLLGILVSIIQAIPYIGLLGLILSIPLSICSFILSIMAVKAVEQLSTWKAVVAVLSPAILGLIFFLCIVLPYLPNLQR